MSRSFTYAVLFALTCAICCSGADSVWIDTDPSVARGGHEVDDGLALVQAFRAPELSVRGISVVFGNAPVSTAFPIGPRLVRDFRPHWNETAFPLIFQLLLGLQLVAAFYTLAIDPVLPDWLADIILRNLRVGDSVATLRFTRNNKGITEHEVIAQNGTFHIMHQPPIGSLSAGSWDRLGALVKDALPF